MALRVFVLDLGGCGACAAELYSAIDLEPALTLVPLLPAADVIALTGVLTTASMQMAVALQPQFGLRPVVAVGRCTLQGTPYGRPALSTWPDLQVRRSIDGCPPLPSAICTALLEAGS